MGTSVPERPPQDYLDNYCVPLSSQMHLRSAVRNLLYVYHGNDSAGSAPWAFAFAKSDCMEQSSDPVWNPNLTVCRRLLKRPCSHRTSALSALGRSTDDARYTNFLIDNDTDIGTILCRNVRNLSRASGEWRTLHDCFLQNTLCSRSNNPASIFSMYFSLKVGDGK